MRNVHAVIALTALAAVSCSKTEDVPCQPGYGLCGGVCVRVADDRDNCGRCGNACGPSDACVAGACVPDCTQSLHAPIMDPWGFAWDGLERPVASYTAARDACTAIGGRLPTASEIVRAGVRTASVGDSYQTDLIWSLAPIDSANALAVKLSDAGASVLAFADTTPHYRCVCPPPRPAAFTGSACFTSKVADGCAALGGNASFNFDGENRTPLPRGAAMYECALAGGELPSAERLAAAFQEGLPNTTGDALHTADDIGAAGAEAAATYGTPPTFTSASSTDWRPFRCFGPTAAGAAATVANGFREPRGERVMDADPDHAVTTYTASLFDCLSRGGHLPTGTELATFAIQGLPAGATTGARWTSDQTDTTAVESFAWSGTAYWPIDPDLATTTATTNGVTFDQTTATRAAKTATLPYRCVYYGVESTFIPPSSTACGTGGCLEVVVGTGSAARARIWFQKSPRGGSGGDTYASAIKYCADLGGRLPSVRDYVEAIHAGLNDTGIALLTSDLVTGPNARTLSWSGTYPSDADPSPSSVPVATAVGVNYACMWTNEIR